MDKQKRPALRWRKHKADRELFYGECFIGAVYATYKLTSWEIRDYYWKCFDTPELGLPAYNSSNQGEKYLTLEEAQQALRAYANKHLGRA